MSGLVKHLRSPLIFFGFIFQPVVTKFAIGMKMSKRGGVPIKFPGEIFLLCPQVMERLCGDLSPYFVIWCDEEVRSAVSTWKYSGGINAVLNIKE